MEDTYGMAMRATRREWLGLGVIALPCLLYSMDLTVLHLAVPHLSRDLRPSATQLLWIVDIYGFFLAGLLIPMGTLGDQIGRRRLLMLGAGAFGAASILAALANSADMLIVARALLGIAGATLAPSTLSLIRNMFHDPRQRTLAIGVWGGCFALGNTLGPIVGGVLLQYFRWGSVFLLAVPLMGLVLILAPLLPESRSTVAGRMDILSAALATASVLAVVYGVKRLADAGWDAWALLTIALGVAVAMIFARRQRMLKDPMIDLSLFSDSTFSIALGASAVGLFAASGSLLYVSQYLQLVCEMSPLRAGIWLAPMGLMHLVSALVTPRLAARFVPRSILTAGFLVTALGYCVLSRVDADGAPLLAVVGAVLFVAGLVPMLTVGTDLVMSAVPPWKAGAASGISETSAELGASLGIAVLGSVAMTVYRGQIGDLALEGAPPEVIAAARDTASGAMAAARYLHGQAAALLIDGAREALTDSLRAISVVNSVLALVAAFICGTYMKGGRRNWLPD